ncbi:MAG: protein kinase [Okeania sp. SIO3B5]|uniref:serine/threonine-protein kinase n=1 Tax=Okeania sp. SIO3B5 TaxID=2607811 RepID=UPI00140045D9|nr:serine/threonine-protein kinase [Okeania sp. SIO3B5]NEO55588.1 protein kinase [Okeania sp. SIO3B5]
MTNLPEFFNQRYQVQQELGCNPNGGRITYLSTDTTTKTPVVTKQYQFANWAEYDSYHREIELLQQINHPSIPRYLDSFETENGFCLVQEYKNAPPLDPRQHWTVAEVKQIAQAVLEVLVYLQQQVPPIIHRDIKPENILVERNVTQLKVYLVDFGFARSGYSNVAVSSAVKGTLGFMPPEQLFNRELTKASDLYSLGATLICLLTNTKSSEIGKLIDDSYRINFKKLLPKLEPAFVNWLEKMLEPNLTYRFPNAEIALQMLKYIENTGDMKTEAMQFGRKKTRKIFAGVATISLCLIAFSSTIAALTTWGENKWLNSRIEQEISRSNARKQHLQQVLLQTNQCPRCELNNVNLAYANLKDVNLKDASLEGADLNNTNLEDADLWKASLGGINLTSANLSNADLRGAKLRYANLQSANLWSANLGYANLWNVNLTQANLRDTNLWGANLGYAKLENANLKNANLLGANLFSAELENADLENANLKNAKLDGVNLKGAKLKQANLKDAVLAGYKGHGYRSVNLENADLESANLEGSNLENANLLGAYLKNANLREASLEGADLRGANLTNANLSKAYLRGANLRGVNLRGAKLDSANIRDTDLKGAIMPDGSIHP